MPITEDAIEEFVLTLVTVSALTHEPFLFACRALTPIIAISRRRFFVSFAARALPPLDANLRLASRSALVDGSMDAIMGTKRWDLQAGPNPLKICESQKRC